MGWMDVDDDDDDVWQTIEKEGLSGNNCLNQLEYWSQSESLDKLDRVLVPP